MNGLLRAMSPTALESLATKLESRDFQMPIAPVHFRSLGYGSESEAVAAELRELSEAGMSRVALARLLRLIAAERVAAQMAVDRTELVWTGPDLPGSRTRDTAVVVRDIFANAERTVLVSTYVVFNGRQVFAPLSERMEKIPGLRVRLFVDVPRRHLDQAPDTQLLRGFCKTFQKDQWPGARLPEVFYDPRSLDAKAGPRSSLHAKAIVVDDLKVFVTSANFTEAAHDRNIECGVLMQSSAVASALTRQFDSMIDAGLLKRLPLA